jgi:hypothetical protein
MVDEKGVIHPTGLRRWRPFKLQEAQMVAW